MLPEEEMIGETNPSTDYTEILTYILSSNEAILNRLEFLIILMCVVVTLLIYKTIRRK